MATKKIDRYHYVECGLSNIYLAGVTAAVCKCGEEEVLIPQVEQLHRLIAGDVASREPRLLPEEIRFLRVYLGMSGKTFAAVMSVSPEAVSRWENGRTKMGLISEKLLRLLVISKAGPFDDYGQFELLATKTQKRTKERIFNAVDHTWRVAA
jgi:putative zinc finger/helix-turn-helix YgiT family protein